MYGKAEPRGYRNRRGHRRSGSGRPRTTIRDRTFSNPRHHADHQPLAKGVSLRSADYFQRIAVQLVFARLRCADPRLEPRNIDGGDETVRRLKAIPPGIGDQVLKRGNFVRLSDGFRLVFWRYQGRHAAAGMNDEYAARVWPEHFDAMTCFHLLHLKGAQNPDSGNLGNIAAHDPLQKSQSMSA